MKSNTSYRFSPITNLEQLLSAINYIATQTTLLAKQATGLDLAIKSLTVFSHYNDEFEVLKNIIKPLGKPHNENNGPRIKLDQPIKSKSHNIEYLRIRHPDPERPQVGCNDFIVENYQNFKAQFLNKNQNLRLIVRPDYEMIEFFDTNFDVLAYSFKIKNPLKAGFKLLNRESSFGINAKLEFPMIKFYGLNFINSRYSNFF